MGGHELSRESKKRKGRIKRKQETETVVPEGSSEAAEKEGDSVTSD